MKKILIGYDEGEASKRGLERAAELAKAFGSELIVVSVSPAATGAVRSGGPVDPTDPPEEHVEELRHAKTYLDGQGLKAHYVTGVAHPAEAIAELAKERGADLIVVGHHHHTISPLLGQSVSESVAHKVNCDVLLVA